jgi:hypothetical protein
VDHAPRRCAPRALPWLGVALCACVTLACDSGGDEVIATPDCLVLTSAPAPLPQTVTVRTGAGSTCNRLELELVVTAVDDVFGAAFTFTFPNAIAVFAGLDDAGSFLEAGGVDPIPFAEVAPDGITVTAGITRQGDVGGVDAGADGALLATLVFQRFAAGGSGDVTFQAAESELLAPGDPAPVPITSPPVTWVGGTLSIVD